MRQAGEPKRPRLDFYISKTTDLSRREARQAIRAGRVRIAERGDERLKGQTPVDPQDNVYLDGERLVLQTGPRYYMLNKPEGVVSATRDDYDPTVLSLVDPGERQDLHPVGRLDKDATGLILLTSDGDWGHRIASPRHGCCKVYRVSVADPMADADLEQLRQGVTLRGEAEPSCPVAVERMGERQLRLTLSEGRYHQVKRMIGAVGNRVTQLHREQVGGIVLDDSLAPGDYRHLTAEEISGAPGD